MICADIEGVNVEALLDRLSFVGLSNIFILLSSDTRLDIEPLIFSSLLDIVSNRFSESFIISSITHSNKLLAYFLVYL
ncbi:hypothetical protein fsci_10650 [Francisella sciaenopsi]|uniref:Uncharacterized protein n=1 Tax=Francisella sciaenopsi TaxID=3055034 RepID=A0ABQ6PF64_9GAMM